MIPILTPAEMRVVDAGAPEPVSVLVERAGWAVGRAAVALLGGTYGRRVAVVAGPGNNGADGRVAARLLRERGAAVDAFEAGDAPSRLAGYDLVIDAAYGTGFHGSWHAPEVVGALVLAVDVPSGVDGLTGAVGGPVMQATHTVCFAALKPGLVLEPGRSRAGVVSVADIGLDVGLASMHLVEADDVRAWVPARAGDAHKWSAALWVIAGSPGMGGAAALAAAAAQRAGAGMVRLSTPGQSQPDRVPEEVVVTALASELWASELLASDSRFHAYVIGPGLGRAPAVVREVRELVSRAPRALVIDGDALFALATAPGGARAVLCDRQAPTVLTPHEGELALLRGRGLGPDRIADVRSFAADVGATVLLKGPTTIVAAPDGQVLLTTTGDARLATAGTGDVLSGLIGALLAQGLPALHAAAAGAWLHGAAARQGPERGLVASDLLDLIPAVLGAL